MANKRIFSTNPDAHSITYWCEEDGKTYLETKQECTPIIDAAKVLAEIPPDPQTGWRFVTAIDEATLTKSFLEGWFHDKAAWRRWARDRDNRLLNGNRENPF